MSVLSTVQNFNLPSASTLPGLFAVVSVGSLVPVLPTGAAVSAAAVLASREGLVPTVLVLAVAWIAAVIGDVTLYKLASWGGEALLERMRLPVSAEHLARAQRQLTDHGKAVLTLSRLIPGGRIPVMVSCVGLGMTVPVFAAADVAAAAAWAGLYGGIGIAGRGDLPARVAGRRGRDSRRGCHRGRSCAVATAPGRHALPRSHPDLTPTPAHRSRSAPRARLNSAAHSPPSSSGPAPSATAVATSSAAQRSAKARSACAAASSSVSTTAPAGTTVPTRAWRCS